MKFNHLNVPQHWEQYWTKYPQGYTILESLISWVSQVDNMVDNQNKLNENVAQFRNEIDAFIGRFEGRLQLEVTNTLKDWQDSGFLDVVISEALQWQLDDYIATNEQDKASLTNQLIKTDEKVNSQFINILFPPLPFAAAVGDGNEDNTDRINQLIKFCETNNRSLFIPKGVFKHTGVKTTTRVKIVGESKTTAILLYYGLETAFKIGNNLESNLDNSKTVFYSDYGNFGIHSIQKAKIGLEVTRLSHSIIENIQVKNFEMAYSIHGYLNDPTPYRGVYNNRFTRLDSIRCDTGFDVLGVISDTYFKECHVEYPTQYGFIFRNPSNQASWNVFLKENTVVGAVGVGVKKCVFIDNAIFRNMKFEGNNFENFTEHGIYQKAASQANAVYSLKTKDNGFFPLDVGSPAIAGIELNNSYGHDLEGNTFFGKNVGLDISLKENALSGFIKNNVAINKELQLGVVSTTNIIVEYKFNDKAKQRTQHSNIGYSAETGDFVVNEVSKGLVVPAPNGELWRIRVTDTGEFFSAKV